MLPAAARLRRRADFTATVRGGHRAGRSTLVVHLTTRGPHTTIEPVPATAGAGSMHDSVRCGFVVSKAVGSAVVRNRVRRRLRHLVRDRLPSLPAGSTLVVRALPAAAVAAYQQLGSDLDKALAAAVGGRRRRRGSEAR